MSHPNEVDGDVPTSVGTQFSAILLSRGAGSLALHHPMAVAETVRPMPSVLSSGIAACQHSFAVEEASMGNAAVSPLLLSTGAQLDLRATETRLRLAQEAELSVLIRLRLLTETLMGVMSACNASGVAVKATTAAHGDGVAEDITALPTDAAFTALLPAVTACSSTTGVEEAMHTLPEARITLRCVAMPPAGLCAAAREQYTALRETLALHFSKPGDSGKDSAGDIAGSNACAPATRTTQDLQFIGHCGATSSAVGSRTTEAVDSGSIDTSTTSHRVADEDTGAPASPTARCLSAVEEQRRMRCFSDLRYCPPSASQRSGSPRRQHSTVACSVTQTSTAAAGTSSIGASWGTRVADSSSTPSHVYGLADRLAGEKDSVGSAETGRTLPKLSPLSVEVSSAEWEAVEERDVIWGGAESGRHKGVEATPASSAPTVSADFATALTRGPSPFVMNVEPCSSSSCRVPPLARRRVATANTWESGDRADVGGQPPQDPPSPPVPFKSSPHRLSQPLSATPTSSVGDAEEEGMYFPTLPTAKTHRRIEGESELSTRPPAAFNSGDACRSANGDRAFPTTLSPTAIATSLSPHCAFVGDRDEVRGDSTGAPQWEGCVTLTASPSTQMLNGGHEGVLQTMSSARCACVSQPLSMPPAPPPTQTRVLTATDILATITALPPSSSSSLLSKPARRGGKGARAMRKTRVALAEARLTRRDARKRTRADGDEWTRIGVSDDALAAVPLEGLPFLGADVSRDAAAALSRGVCEDVDDARYWRSAPALCTERGGDQKATLEEEIAPSGCVRTPEQRAGDVAQAERVLSAVRARCRLTVPTSLQNSSRCCGTNDESDEALSSPSPSLSQNTPRQFWDINFP
ncbi:hypothetical protein LSCM4_05243 [Leishmania orientalis]|uniref:Uncharacterized protein n=1 Tax=Leishmania orientalis TaxID=2249476 RepID=A0A836HGC6_9TRYP|nr:hypothetical protein LSCM4_05243 [Leishmania orientalis]